MSKVGRMALVLAVLAYGVTILVSVLGVQRVDYATLPDTGEMTFQGDRILGLPAFVELGAPNAVRILLPEAASGSRLEISVFVSPGVVEHADVLLCPPGLTGEATTACDIEASDSGFVYSAESAVELPAVLTFPESLGTRTVRLQYEVVGPDLAWNPLDTPESRVYILGEFTLVGPD
jgi:hypothetical protein